MRCGYLLTVLTLALSVDLLAPGGGRTLPSDCKEGGRFAPVTVRWPPQAVMCGPNALYMLLKAHDRPVPANRFFQEIDPGDQGLSLSELHDASGRYGLPSVIRLCTYEQLCRRCPFPVVALLHPKAYLGSHGAGHYVLVIDADSEAVTLIDGTSGKENRCAPGEFCRDWHGYVIVPAVGQTSWLPLAITSAACALVGWLILRQGRSVARAGRLILSEVSRDASSRCDPAVSRRQSGWSWVGCVAATLVVLAVIQAGGMSGETGGGFVPWRCPERDGINCLYLELRLLGFMGTYQEVVAALPGGAEQASLDGLARWRSAWGFRWYQPSSLWPNCLVCVRLP